MTKKKGTICIVPFELGQSQWLLLLPASRFLTQLFEA